MKAWWLVLVVACSSHAPTAVAPPQPTPPRPTPDAKHVDAAPDAFAELGGPSCQAGSGCPIPSPRCALDDGGFCACEGPLNCGGAPHPIPRSGTWHCYAPGVPQAHCEYGSGNGYRFGFGFGYGYRYGFGFGFGYRFATRASRKPL